MNGWMDGMDEVDEVDEVTLEDVEVEVWQL